MDPYYKVIVESSTLVQTDYPALYHIHLNTYYRKDMAEKNIRKAAENDGFYIVVKTATGNSFLMFRKKDDRFAVAKILRNT